MPRAKSIADAVVLAAALSGLEAQKRNVEAHLEHVRRLLGTGKGKAGGRRAAQARPRRALSAAARKRIADAQKRRWAEYRKRKAAAAK